VIAFAAPTPSVGAHAAADGVPKLDIAQTCRTSTENKGAFDTCMRDEDRAREQLAGGKHCIQLSSMKGFQSYVELLTCLEMAADARTLPKDITQQ
jgi:hypothetical protein